MVHSDTRCFCIVTKLSFILHAAEGLRLLLFHLCVRNHMIFHLCFSLCVCSTPLPVSLTLTNDLLPCKISVPVFESSQHASGKTARPRHLFLLEAFFPFGFQAATLFWFSFLSLLCVSLFSSLSFPQLLVARWVLPLVFPQFGCAFASFLLCFVSLHAMYLPQINHV